MGHGSREQEYIGVGDLSAGFSENILQPTDELAGKHIVLDVEAKKRISLFFLDQETLKCEIEEQGNREKYICPYTAIAPREKIYFVDFILSCGVTDSVSVILDMKKEIATVITCRLPDEKESSIPILVRAERGMPLSAVKVTVEHGAVNKAFSESTPRHEKTTDLIGKRMQFVYSAKDGYEHIYLNENCFCWHCISGNEQGLSDVESCLYYKIDEKLYCLIWFEKIIPTMGIVVQDWNVMRSYGKIYGYEKFGTGKVVNFPAGSYATFLNETTYDRSRLK